MWDEPSPLRRDCSRRRTGVLLNSDEAGARMAAHGDGGPAAVGRDHADGGRPATHGGRGGVAPAKLLA